MGRRDFVTTGTFFCADLQQHLTCHREYQRKNQRIDNSNIDKDLEKFLHRTQKQHTYPRAWLTKKIVAGDLDNETGHR